MWVGFACDGIWWDLNSWILAMFPLPCPAGGWWSGFGGCVAPNQGQPTELAHAEWQLPIFWAQGQVARVCPCAWKQSGVGSLWLHPACKDLQSPRGIVKHLSLFTHFSFSSRGDKTTAETVLPQGPSANTILIQKKTCKGVLENIGSFIDQKQSEQSLMYVTFFL